MTMIRTPAAPSPDWKAIAQDLAGALDTCSHQVEQMQGLFKDDDGTIAGALGDAEEAMAMYLKALETEKQAAGS